MDEVSLDGSWIVRGVKPELDRNALFRMLKDEMVNFAVRGLATHKAVLWLDRAVTL